MTLHGLDRVADARARMYGAELRALIATASACGIDAVPVAALELLADRMDGGNVVDLAGRREFSLRVDRITEAQFDQLIEEGEKP